MALLPTSSRHPVGNLQHSGMGHGARSTQGRHHRPGKLWRRCGNRVLRASEQTDIDRVSAGKRRRVQDLFWIGQGSRGNHGLRAVAERAPARVALCRAATAAHDWNDNSLFDLARLIGPARDRPGDENDHRMTIEAKPRAEVTIDPSLVRALLEEQHTDLAHLALIDVGEGWDNKLFRLGNDLAVRVPRRAASAALIEREQQWLPQMSPRLPLPVPAPLRIGRPGSWVPMVVVRRTVVPRPECAGCATAGS